MSLLAYSFPIPVLDQTLTYEVDQISIVLPTEIENLYIEDSEDYCTLMTCTPYGINSHRLLVRGHRTDNEAHIRVVAEASEVNTLLVALAVATPLLAALLIWLLASTRKRGGQTEHAGRAPRSRQAPRGRRTSRRN